MRALKSGMTEPKKESLTVIPDQQIKLGWHHT